MTIYKCSIIANPEGNAWNFASEVYKRLRARSDKYELIEVRIKKFPDDEIKPKIEKNVRKKNCFFIHDSTLNSNDWFLQLTLINEALRNSSAQEITDVLPYLRFARQDRKDESRVAISSKVVADVIRLYANRVLSVDVHNPSIAGFYNIPFDNLYSFPVAIDYLKRNYSEFVGNLVIMSPDVGGAKRVEAFAKRINAKGMVVGYKVREKEKESIGEVDSLRIIGDVAGKNVLIVDDIISSGGTIIKACEAARSFGATKVGVYAPHGLFTEGTEKLTNCVDLIIVGDSFPNPNLENEKIKIVSFADLFAEAIYRINEGESLSALFD